MPGGNTVLDEHVDENYEPKEQEIEEYAEWLGMDLEKDRDLFWIARQGLKAPLPKPWKPCQSEEQEIFYFNFETGESVWDHPCDDHFRKVYQEHKARKEGRAYNPDDAKKDKKDKKKDKKDKKNQDAFSVGSRLSVGSTELDFQKHDLPKPGESLFGKKNSKLTFDCRPKASPKAGGADAGSGEESRPVEKAKPNADKYKTNNPFSSSMNTSSAARDDRMNTPRDDRMNIMNNSKIDDEAERREMRESVEQEFKLEKNRLEREHRLKLDEIDREFDEKRRMKSRELEAELTRDMERKRADLERTLRVDMEKAANEKVQREVDDKLRFLREDLEREARTKMEENIEVQMLTLEAEKKNKAEQDLQERLKPWLAEAEANAKRKMEKEVEEGTRAWAAGLEERTMESRRAAIEREADQKAVEMRRVREQEFLKESERIKEEYEVKRKAIEEECELDLSKAREQSQGHKGKGEAGGFGGKVSDVADDTDHEQARRIKELEAALAAAEDRIKAFEQQVANLEKKTEAADTELARLRTESAELAVQKARLNEAERFAESVSKDAERLRNELAERDQRLEALNQQVLNLQREAASQVSSTADTTAVVELARSERDAAIRKTEEQAAKLAEETRQREASKAQLQDAERCRTDVEQRAKDLGAKLVEEEARLAHANAELDRLRETLAKVEGKSNAAETSRASLEEDLRNTRDRLARTEAEVQVLQASVKSGTSVAADSVAHAQQVEVLRRENEDLRSRLAVETQALRKENDGLRSQQGVDQVLRKENEDLRSQFAVETQALRKENDSLRSQQGVDQGVAERERVQLQTLRKENEDLRCQLAAETQALRKENDSLRSHQGVDQVLRKENEDLRSQLAAKTQVLCIENDSLRSQQGVDQVLRKENEDLRSQLAAETQALRKEIDSLRSQQGVDQVLRKENEDLRSQHAAETQALRKESESLRSQLAVETQALRRENENLRSQLNEASSINSRNSDGLQTALAAADNRTAEASRRYEESISQVGELRAEIVQLRSKNASAESNALTASAVKQQEVEALKREVDSLRCQLAAQGTKEADTFKVSAERREIEALKTQIESLRAQLAADSAEAVRRLSEAERRACDAATELARESAAKTTAISEVRTFQGRAEVIEAASESLRKALSEADSRATTALMNSEQKAKEVRDLRSEMQELRMQIDTSQYLHDQSGRSSEALVGAEEMRSLRAELSRCKLLLASAERRVADEEMRADVAASGSSDEVIQLRSELSAAELEMASRSRRLANDLGRRSSGAGNSPDASEVLRSELRAARSEISDLQVDEQAEVRRARDCREHARQELREESKQTQRRLALAEEEVQKHQERVRRLSVGTEADKKDTEDKLERVRAEVRRLEQELDDVTARSRAEARRHDEVLSEREVDLRVARRQLAAKEAELKGACTSSDARNRQEEANLQIQFIKVAEREAVVEDRQRLLDEKERLLRSAERALQRRLSELEDDAARLSSEVQRVETQRSRRHSAAMISTDVVEQKVAPLAASINFGNLDLRTAPGAEAIGLSAIGMEASSQTPMASHRLGQGSAFASVGISGIERTWRPDDIETESLSKCQRSASLSGPPPAPIVGEGLPTTSLPPSNDIGHDKEVGIEAKTSVTTGQPHLDKSPRSVDSDDESLTPRLRQSGLNAVKKSSAEELERSLLELQKLGRENVVMAEGIDPSSVLHPHAPGDVGSSLLAAAREQRKRLRRRRALLEVDMERWQQDVENQRMLDPAGKAVASARSRELLAEVKRSLDTQAQRIAADLREAKAVERMLLGQGACLPDTNSQTAPFTSSSPATDAVNIAARDAVANDRSAEMELAKVAWEEENLLRRWQAHIGSWPTSFGTAPLSARNSRTSTSVDVARDRGVGGCKALSSRPSSVSAHKSTRRRPLSARERQVWPADLLSAREPLTSRGVISGHSAWLRGFHQQLCAPSVYTPGNVVFASR